MDLVTRRLDFKEIFKSTTPGCSSSPFSAGKICSGTSPLKTLNVSELDISLLDSVLKDDKAQFITQAKQLFYAGDEAESIRRVSSKLLSVCCAFDSVDCATSLMNGEVGTVPYVNEVDPAAGLSALHIAAEAHATRCVAMLLKRRARTDVKSRDGRALLPLELSLCSGSLDVPWSPEENTMEDLLVMLAEKDLTVIKLLTEKTKEVDTMAYAYAIDGRVVSLAVLLIVAAEKIDASILMSRDNDLASKQKSSIYECVIREALFVGSSRQSGSTLKRKLLLYEIELLQLFGAVAYTNCVDKRQTSILFSAIQAGDWPVLELLLKANVDVNETDIGGHTAVQCSLKTSSVSHAERTRMLSLLMEHGARVNQKNKLGLTALHIAAENGNLDAVEILLREDPDLVNVKSEIKETPLFFAVKNDHPDCVKLLLRWGASTEIHNLRRQRPIDLADSQDMRFILNPINICQLSRAKSEDTHAQLYDTQDTQHTNDAFLRKLAEERGGKRSMVKVGLCKYFESPTGCDRGSKCFYAHGQEELRHKQAASLKFSTIKDVSQKVFVGGLPPSLDSGSLGKFFEELFGSVKEALVMEAQTGDSTQSRGFGFVVFKHEESFSEAVQARYAYIMGKRVEIKAAVSKILPSEEFEELGSGRSEEKKTAQCQTQPQEDISSAMLSLNQKEEFRSENTSWAGMLLHGQPTKSSPTSQACSPIGKPTPLWFKKFFVWLPRFLKEVSNCGSESEYPLSSLKGDFRAIFGMELDHASLGFQKLSDFVKCFPNLCQMKVVPIGPSKPATHWVLLPSPSKLKRKPLQPLPTSNLHSQVSCNSNSFKHPTPVSSPTLKFTDSYTMSENASEVDFIKNHSQRFAENVLAKQDSSPCTPFALMGSSEQESPISTLSLSPANGYQGRHLVLETLAKKRGSKSVFFLREFDFFLNYEASISQGKCFWCNQPKLLWSNSPCRHKLWCITCREEAARAAGNFEHKCVVCDKKVERFILAPPNSFDHPWLRGARPV